MIELKPGQRWRRTFISGGTIEDSIEEIVVLMEPNSCRCKVVQVIKYSNPDNTYKVGTVWYATIQQGNNTWTYLEGQDASEKLTTTPETR
jgi:hypothetical protein